MGTIFNSKVFKGVSIKGQTVKGLAKNGVVFWKQQSFHQLTNRILARSTEIGATPPTNLILFDNYIRSIADILIENFDVFFRFRGSGDVNFKRINLANPEGALADFYGGYTLDITGFKGNGINTYIDTNFNPSLLVAGQKYQVSDASRGIILVEVGSEAVIDGIPKKNIFSNLMSASNAVTHRINQGSTNLSSRIDFSETGIKILNRTTDSNNTNGINKASQYSANAVSGGVILSENQAVLRQARVYGNSLASSYFMGKSISFELSQQLRNIENADMANLGLPQIA